MRAPQIGIHNKNRLRGEPLPVQTGAPIVVRPVDPRLQLKNGRRQNNPHNRLILWRTNPHCHWCGLETILAPKGTKTLFHYHATVDHIHGHRSDKRDEIVLACHGCNQKRGKWAATHRRKPDPERRENTLRRLYELMEAR